MKQVLLDTNFILTCARQKIDFFEEIPLIGMQILIPEQVINEVKKLKSSNSELVLKILQKNQFKQIDIGSGHVDKSIIKFAKQHQDIVVATLDRELKKKLKNQKLIIRGKKKLEII